MSSNYRSGKLLQNVKQIFWYFAGSQYGFGYFMITIILDPVVRHVVSPRNLMGTAPFRRKLTFRWKGNCDNLYLEKFKPQMGIKICCVSSDLNTIPDVKMLLLQPMVVKTERSLKHSSLRNISAFP